MRRPKANRLTLIVLSAAFCLFEITMDAGVSFADASPEAERAARVAFEDGRDAYNQGEFAAALVLFERAHALSPKSELLYNIGRAADSDGQNERAIGAYSAYLEAFPQSENREFVRARLEKMRARRAAEEAAPHFAPAAQLLPTTDSVEHAQAPFHATQPNEPPTRPLWKGGWFWTGIGVVMAGVATTIVLSTRDHAPERAQTDVSVRTLESSL